MIPPGCAHRAKNSTCCGGSPKHCTRIRASGSEPGRQAQPGSARGGSRKENGNIRQHPPRSGPRAWRRGGTWQAPRRSCENRGRRDRLLTLSAERTSLPGAAAGQEPAPLAPRAQCRVPRTLRAAPHAGSAVSACSRFSQVHSFTVILCTPCASLSRVVTPWASRATEPLPSA